MNVFRYCSSPSVVHILLPQSYPASICVIVDTLTAGRDLQATDKAGQSSSCILRILRVIHRVERTLLGGIMGDKYKIRAVFFLKVATDQRVLPPAPDQRGCGSLLSYFSETSRFRLDQSAPPGSCSTSGSSTFRISRSCSIFAFQQVHRVLKEACLHCHNIRQNCRYIPSQNPGRCIRLNGALCCASPHGTPDQPPITRSNTPTIICL